MPTHSTDRPDPGRGAIHWSTSDGLFGPSTDYVCQDHVSDPTLLLASFQNSMVDPDVWLGAAVKMDSTKYYEYAMCYVNDIIMMSEKPNLFMKLLGT